MIGIKRLATAAALAAMLALTACGSSKKSDSKASDTTKSEQTAATDAGSTGDSTAGTEPATTGGSTGDTTGDSTASTTPITFTGKGAGDFCALYKKFESEFSGGNSGITTKDDFDKIEAAVKQLETIAPSEIKGDVKTEIALFAKLRAVYEKYNYDEKKISDAFLTDPELQKVVSDPAADEANKRLNAYTAQVCGVTGS